MYIHAYYGNAYMEKNKQIKLSLTRRKWIIVMAGVLWLHTMIVYLLPLSVRSESDMESLFPFDLNFRIKEQMPIGSARGVDVNKRTVTMHSYS